jgi:hypothetical protein
MNSQRIWGGGSFSLPSPTPSYAYGYSFTVRYSGRLSYLSFFSPLLHPSYLLSQTVSVKEIRLSEWPSSSSFPRKWITCISYEKKEYAITNLYWEYIPFKATCEHYNSQRRAFQLETSTKGSEQAFCFCCLLMLLSAAYTGHIAHIDVKGIGSPWEQSCQCQRSNHYRHLHEFWQLTQLRTRCYPT